jgi:ribonuclease/clavin/mitogillin
MNLINVGYSSTHYYLIQQGPKRLLVDVGIPGSLPRLIANLKRYDLTLDRIDYLLATHYHPDHAGIAQDVKNHGVRLVVLDIQQNALVQQTRYVKPDSGYLPIRADDNLVLTAADSRAFLASLGLAGEIVATPGHSDDSISLVLDSGEAFTGDLPPAFMAEEPSAGIVAASWRALAALGATTIYPGHGPTGRKIDTIS